MKVNISALAQAHGYSEAKAQELWDANMLAAGAGGVKAVCTGRNTHKPAFIGWVRLSVFKDGKYAIGMSETGNAQNYQNSSGLQGGDQKMQGNLWPIKEDDGSYIPGASGESYRFICRRCRRDVQISSEKLGHAVQVMLVNKMKYFDLSALPFA